MAKRKQRGNGEGSIYEHKRDGKKVGSRGAYTVYTSEGPKRRYVSGKDRDEVRRKLTEAMAYRDKGLVFNDENLTVGEYLDRWLSDSVRGTVRESTYSRDKYLVINHIKPTLGRLRLKTLNALHAPSTTWRASAGTPPRPTSTGCWPAPPSGSNRSPASA